jgi:uncharacterized membrane protein YcgQ (UPF0703/DUF1980 family)
MNKSKLIFIIVLALLAILFAVTLFYNSDGNARVNLPPGVHGVVVSEVIHTTNYTYLEVEENGQKYWIAVVRSDTEKGDSVYYSKAFEMKNFQSRELNRTFPSVLFVDDPSETLVIKETPANQAMSPQKVEIKRWSEVSVETPAGGITIADLYKDPGSYTGKEVTIRGVVVRYNSEIMNRNWVHIQDGTDFAEKFDLTVTTQDSLIVGSTATFKGTIALSKDFGSGYYYDVIMEGAKASDIR